MASDRPRILLDVDGVVADFQSAACCVTSEVLGTSYQPQHSGYDMFAPLEAAVRHEVFRRIGAAGFCASIAPYPGAVDGVRTLATVADVVFVTSPWRSPTWAGERAEWLAHWFGDELGRRVISTNLKHLVTGDVLVDDKPTTVAEWRQRHPQGIGVVWAQPYNAGADVWRTNDWEWLVTLAKVLRWVM